MIPYLGDLTHSYLCSRRKKRNRGERLKKDDHQCIYRKIEKSIITRIIHIKKKKPYFFPRVRLKTYFIDYVDTPSSIDYVYKPRDQ